MEDCIGLPVVNGFLLVELRKSKDTMKTDCSEAEIACKRRPDFYLGHDRGYMIPIHSKIGQGMRFQFEK